MPESRRQRTIFITGVSGGGKGTALKALEDAGWFCIDNLPVPVVPRLIELFALAPEVGQLALVIDAREQRFLGDAPRVIEEARKVGDVTVLFLDASDDVLIRRFSETRRRHPMSPDGTVIEGIAAERLLLAGLRGAADDVIDTSRTNVHELKSLVQERYAAGRDDRLSVTITSFGYRHGVPPQADLVLDVRFLPNPYFVPELKAKAGNEAEVADWVLGQPDAQEFLVHIRRLLDFLLPRYRGEGKSYLTVALGCTGGRHRSVALAEALGRSLQEQGVAARVRHRDVERGA